MDIQYPAGVMPHEFFTQDAHKPGQQQQIRLVGIENVANCVIIGLPIRIFAVTEHLDRDGGVPGAL